MPILTSDKINSVVENYIITCGNLMFKNSSLNKDEMEIVSQTWGLQLVNEGIIMREFIIGSKEINCYFENEDKIFLTNDESRKLRSFHANQSKYYAYQGSPSNQN